MTLPRYQLLHPDSIFFTFFFNGMFCRSILDQRITKVFCWIEEYEVNEQKQTDRKKLKCPSKVFSCFCLDNLAQFIQAGGSVFCCEPPKLRNFFCPRNLFEEKSLLHVFLLRKHIVHLSMSHLFQHLCSPVFALIFYLFLCPERKKKKLLLNVICIITLLYVASLQKFVWHATCKPI